MLSVYGSVRFINLPLEICFTERIHYLLLVYPTAATITNVDRHSITQHACGFDRRHTITTTGCKIIIVANFTRVDQIVKLAGYQWKAKCWSEENPKLSKSLVRKFTAVLTR